MDSWKYDPVLADALPGLPAYNLRDIAKARLELRDRVAKMTGTTPVSLEGLSIRNVAIPPSPSGSPGVDVRVYRPANAKAPCPALLHIHGGGFVMGDLENSHGRCARLSRDLAVCVVSVDYRLAPESPFPAALHDISAALHWMASEKGENHGIDSERILLHGISSGAGLVASLTLWTRDFGGPKACFQFLEAPALDDRLETSSMRQFRDAPGWSRAQAELSWNAYLAPQRRGGQAITAYAAPARAEDLSGVPAAYISVMENDPLRDEGLNYGRALLAAGVSTEVHLFPGTFHGSANVSDAPTTIRQLEEEARVLTTALSHYC